LDSKRLRRAKKQKKLSDKLSMRALVSRFFFIEGTSAVRFAFAIVLKNNVRETLVFSSETRLLHARVMQTGMARVA